MSALLNDETQIRLLAFLTMLLIMGLWERRQPRRELIAPVRLRWVSNLGIGALNVLVIRLLFPFLGMSLALEAESRNWGLFGVIQSVPAITVVCSIILLDAVIYFQHRLFHAVPLLWRLHRMHHADYDFDTTTGIRFHPLEAVLSMVIKFVAIIAIGAPAISVLVFEVTLNATSLFNHGNVRIPHALDRVLRWLIVTPDMHRVHHSTLERELNRNFGFNLPWWDRLFSTYQAQPEAGHEQMQIGLSEFRTAQDLRLDRMLAQPFLER